jgi:hypothetical protein
MLENKSSGPGVSLAASIEKWGKAHTGMLKTVRSGRPAAILRASPTASRLVHTGSLARTTSCPAASREAEISASTPLANFSMSLWTPSRPSDIVRTPTRATSPPFPHTWPAWFHTAHPPATCDRSRLIYPDLGTRRSTGSMENGLCGSAWYQ